MLVHETAQGECFSSISVSHGFCWRKLWNHADNADLRNLRKDPNILFPGDLVHIPDKTMKEESRATGARHKFVRNGVPAKLKLRLLADGKPRKNEKYRLEIDGHAPLSGSTDGDGRISQPIPPTARTARLFLGQSVYYLQLGCLDPATQVSGIKGRLTALGYPCGEPDGEVDDLTRDMLRAFQLDNHLSASGDIDDATRDKLKQLYGS